MLIDVLVDDDVGSVLSADELTWVDADVEDPAEETADDPDDRSACDCVVVPETACELLAVTAVPAVPVASVASEPDCSGAASAERVEGAIASALAPSPKMMAPAAPTVTTARAAAPSGPGNGMRRARPTAIKPP